MQMWSWHPCKGMKQLLCFEQHVVRPVEQHQSLHQTCYHENQVVHLVLCDILLLMLLECFKQPHLEAARVWARSQIALYMH